jgi:hypothetical protein
VTRKGNWELGQTQIFRPYSPFYRFFKNLKSLEYSKPFAFTVSASSDSTNQRLKMLKKKTAVIPASGR